MDQAAFEEAAGGAKAGCPVSRALAGVPEITLEATLDCHDVPGGTARAQVREALEATGARVQALAARHGEAPFGEEQAREGEPAHAGT